jgi:hypothetical protein
MWISLGNYILNEGWQAVPVVIDGEIFRLTHGDILNPSKKYLKAAIAQGNLNTDGTLDLFEKQLFSHEVNREVRVLPFPIGLPKRDLFVKRLDSTTLPWVVRIEVWQPESSRAEHKIFLFYNFFVFLRTTA